MAAHGEETNELFNLMARQIKKRAEERVNLFMIEDREGDKPWGIVISPRSSSDRVMNPAEMDDYLLSNENEPQPTHNGHRTEASPKQEDGSRQSSRGNSPPKEPIDSTMMQTMLASRQAATSGKVKTVKPFRLQPKVIFLKNSRDRVMLMTEKNATEEVPECEHGYWGGFSPQRRGKYEGKHLSKRFENGRARLYPGGRKIHGAIKRTPQQPTVVLASEHNTSPNQTLEN